MSVHGTATGGGFFFNRSVGIQLGKEFLNVGKFKGEHERLVAVVSTAPIARFKYFSHGNLGDFFTIAEDAKFCFTGKHFFSSDERGVATLIGDFVVL